LTTKDVLFGFRLALQFAELRENAVIIVALLAAVILLVAVTFISSIDLSKTRRH
jgi:CHASE1-domain containing sensor protein